MTNREAQFKMLQAMAEAIRTAGSIPSGHLYAMVMGHMGIDTYNSVIDTLKGAGLVTEKFHELIWNEPKEVK